VDNVLQAAGDITSNSDPAGEVRMDPASESKSDEEGGWAERGGGGRVTPRTQKRGTSVFQVATKDTQLKTVHRMLK